MSSKNGVDYCRIQRAATRDRSVPMGGQAKTRRIDLGLELLARVTRPGHGHSLQDIAAWCGCTRDAILLTEQKALKKLRNRLRFGARCAVGRELRS